MKFRSLDNTFTYFVFLFFLLLVAGCQSNFKDIQSSQNKDLNPIGEVNGINLKYTDSGRIQTVLLAKKMLDFSNVDYPFTEFPEGVDITFYDKNGDSNFIRSDYAITYDVSKIIDLRGKVKITSHDGKVFETEQLYYDQKNEWFFTEKRFKLRDSRGIIYGEGVDFRKDLEITNIHNFSAEIDEVEEN